MQEYKGIVEWLDGRDWKNGIVLWSFRVNGNPVVHNCGSNDPKITIGDSIKFSVVNKKVDTSTIERIPAEEALKGTPPKQESPAASVRGSTGDVGARIQRQLARRDAVLLVTTAMNTDLLPYPKSGKATDKWNRMLDLIHETSNDLLQMEEEWTTKSG